MSVKFETEVTEILDSAVSAFGDAMKSGVKAQEDAVKWWSNALNGPSPIGEWQKRAKQMYDVAVPAAQKQAQDWTKLIEQNYRRSIDLVKRAVDTESDCAVGDLRQATCKLFEDSLAVFKENVEALAQANVKMVEVWTEILRKNLEQSEAALKVAAANAPKAPK